MYNIIDILIYNIEESPEVIIKKQIYHNGFYYNTEVYIYECKKICKELCVNEFIKEFLIKNINKYNYIISEFYLDKVWLSIQRNIYFNLLGYKLDIKNDYLQINGIKFSHFLWFHFDDDKKFFRDMCFLMDFLKNKITIEFPTSILFENEEMMNSFLDSIDNYMNEYGVYNYSL